jgi:glycosyltransferase involved in cell wall biosynthesis
MGTELSVVIPAYNDQAGLEVLLPEAAAALSELGVPWEIVVVDDGSQPPIVRPASVPPARLRLIRHALNRGYGAALKTGIRAAAGAFVVAMDADHQHDPADIARFYARAQGRDMVVGLRSHHRDSPLWRRPGKLFLTWLLNSMSPRRIADINCGFRCIRREAILKHLDLCADGFSFSLSSTVLMLHRGADVEFEAVATRERIGKSSVRVKTGLQTIILIIRIVVFTSPMRLFLPLSAVLFLAGVAWTTPCVLRREGVISAGIFLMLAGLLSFLLGVLPRQFPGLFKRLAGR